MRLVEKCRPTSLGKVSLDTNYHRGSQPAVNSPEDEFHTHVFDWLPNALTWYIDRTNVHAYKNTSATNGAYQYPQTPS